MATKSTKPKLRVRAEERRLRRLEFFQRDKGLFDRERAMRQLRDTRAQAEALEHCLAALNPAYRQAAEGRRHIKDLAGTAFRGRALPEEVLRFYPASYGRLREALDNK